MSRGSKLQNFVGSQAKLSQLLVMLKPFSKETISINVSCYQLRLP